MNKDILRQTTGNSASSNHNTRKWCCCCNFSSKINYHQRIAFSFCILLYYIVQLALYPKSVGTIDEDIRQLILFLEISLFLLSLTALLFAWIFRPIFEKYALIWDSLIMSFTIVWLIVNVPIYSMIASQCIVNLLIFLCVLYIDMSVQLYTQPQTYIYPWVTSKKFNLGRNPKKTQSVENSDGKRSLFSVSMWNTSKQKETLKKAKLSTKTKKKQRRYQQGYELTDSSGDKPGKEKQENMHEFFENQESSSYSRNSSEIMSDLNYSIDLEKQSSFPLSMKDEDDDDIELQARREDSEESFGSKNDRGDTNLGNADEMVLKNFHFDLTTPVPVFTNGSNQLKSLCTGFRINVGQLPVLNGNIPTDIVWSDFINIQHIVDSSSCHIYIAQWIHHNPYLSTQFSGFNSRKEDAIGSKTSSSNTLSQDTNSSNQNASFNNQNFRFPVEPEGIYVVIKLIKAERVSSPVAVSEFDMEEQILSRIAHPNIIKLLGSGTVPRKFLILECLQGGTLAHILGLRPVDPLLLPPSDRPELPSVSTAYSISPTPTVMITQLSFLEILYLLQDLAKSLHYLHKEWCDNIHILHRDLKPDNIGFTSDGKLKLFDFGLAAIVRAQKESTEAYKLTGNTGTLRYMAPEVVLGRSYHQSVDAYSFGILSWQIASSGKVPFGDLGKKVYYDKVVLGGQRLKLLRQWPMQFQNLLKACWAEDKNARPQFSQILQELEHLIQTEEQLIAWKQASYVRKLKEMTQRVYLASWGMRYLGWLVGAALIGLGVVTLLNRDEIQGGSLPISIMCLLIGISVGYGITMTYLPIANTTFTCKYAASTYNNSNNSTVNPSAAASLTIGSINSSNNLQSQFTNRLNSLDSTGITRHQQGSTASFPSTPTTDPFVNTPQTPPNKWLGNGSGIGAGGTAHRLSSSLNSTSSSNLIHRIMELEEDHRDTESNLPVMNSNGTTIMNISSSKKKNNTRKNGGVSTTRLQDDEYHINPLYQQQFSSEKA